MHRYAHTHTVSVDQSAVCRVHYKHGAVRTDRLRFDKMDHSPPPALCMWASLPCSALTAVQPPQRRAVTIVTGFGAHHTGESV